MFIKPAFEVSYSVESSRFSVRSGGKTVRRIARDFALNHDEQVICIAQELVGAGNFVIGAIAKGYVIVSREGW